MSTDRPEGDLGKKLREARERKGVSLRQIANSTKIAVGVLEALERNDISRLPGGIFGRAFVRAFAVEIGLEPEVVIQEFVAQFPRDSVTVGHPASEQIEDNEALESNRRMASTFLRLIAISIPIAGVITYFSVSGRHDQTETVSRAPEVVTSQSTPPSPEPTNVAATSAPVDETLVESAVVPPSRGDQRSMAVEAAGDRLLVALTASRRCWVSATVDGQKEIARVLQMGEQKTLEIRRELVLTAGDAGALSFTINGVAGKPLGKAGEVATAKVDLTNFRAYLQ